MSEQPHIEMFTEPLPDQPRSYREHLNELPRDWDEAVRWLHELLKHQQPNRFGPAWLTRHAPALHRFFYLALKGEPGQPYKRKKLAWERLKQALKTEWQPRWHVRETSSHPAEQMTAEQLREFLRQLGQRLLTLLEKESPDEFTATWVYDHDRPLYHDVIFNIRGLLIPSWDCLIKGIPKGGILVNRANGLEPEKRLQPEDWLGLPAAWQGRWKYGRQSKGVKEGLLPDRL